MAAEKKLFVTLVGGGNSTLCLSPLVKMAGHTLAIVTRKPKEWNSTIEVVNDDTEWLNMPHMSCEPDFITDDYSKVIPQSDIIFIAGVPIHHNPTLLANMKPHIDSSKKVYIGSICAYGGFNWVLRTVLGNSESIVPFGTQLIPWCCGTLEYGRKGIIIGAKRVLRIATETGDDQHGIKDLLKPILKQNLVDTDFLASSLWPNNPSLHPPILYGLFKDWDGVTPYDPTTLPVKIYAEMTPASAEYVCELDRELVSIIAKLREHFPNNKHLQNDFSMKYCVLENYEDQVVDKSTTTSCVQTNKAFGKHCLPYAKVEGGIVPVLAHKFFETDLPFGLVMWKDIADMIGVKIPLTEAIINWNQKLINKEYLKDGQLTGRDIDEAIVPSRMGIKLSGLCGGIAQ